MKISTTGEPARILVSADRKRLIDDRRDVAHIAVEIQDEHGHLVPVADNLITFDIQGEGKVIVVDNGDPHSNESFNAKQRKAFNGKCLAILQSTAKAGQILVTVSTPSLPSATLIILS
jgi:beta-galactosidase